eukprot:SM001482S01139  [mRNA]  locus=s1482:285:2050:+ [translate_table: standard]
MHCNAEALLQLALGSPSPGAAEPVARDLPERPGQPVCTYYMRTGTCSYRAPCRYHHPPQRRPVRSALPAYQPIAALTQPMRPGTPAAPGPRAQSSVPPAQRRLRGAGWLTFFPARALRLECCLRRASLQARAKPTPPNTRKDRASQTYYMKTGQCKYGPSCRFNHPQEHGLRAAQAPLNPSGLPLRPRAPVSSDNDEHWVSVPPGRQLPLPRSSLSVKLIGAPAWDEKDCSFYLRTGQCKYGVTCKFNHPQAPIHDGPGSSVTFALTPGSPSTGPAPPSGWPILRPSYLSLPQLQSPGAFSGPTLVLPTGPQGVMQMHPAWNYQSHVLHVPFVRNAKDKSR